MTGADAGLAVPSGAVAAGVDAGLAVPSGAVAAGADAGLAVPSGAVAAGADAGLVVLSVAVAAGADAGLAVGDGPEQANNTAEMRKPVRSHSFSMMTRLLVTRAPIAAPPKRGFAAIAARCRDR